MIRSDGRNIDSIREVNIIPSGQIFAEGSVVINMGRTKVLCSVSVEESVPQFLKGSGKGWITAEYGMLPRSTLTRNSRETVAKGIRGRTHEIQRLIGRSMRAAVNLELLGERTLIIDCDVLQADGGTRTASITGAYVALYQCLSKLLENKSLSKMPLRYAVSAVSVGWVDGEVILDLDYDEDYRADADFNIVLTDHGEFIEVQGTGEEISFPAQVLEQVLKLAEFGGRQLFKIQSKVIESLST